MRSQTNLTAALEAAQAANNAAAAANAAASAAREVVGEVSQDMNQIRSDIVANAKADAKTAEKVDALWKLNEGISYDFAADAEESLSSGHVRSLFKTPFDDFNDDRLFFCRHLIIAWQAQAPGENVSAHVLHAAGDISVSLSASLTGNGDEAVHAVHGLHVHGLPIPNKRITAICSVYINYTTQYIVQKTNKRKMCIINSPPGLLSTLLFSQLVGK